MLLSSVAERLYWMGRYLERAETTARLMNVYSGLMPELPKTLDLGWWAPVSIIGYEAAFRAHYTQEDEHSVMSFMLGDAANPSSVLSCLESARANARAVRVIIPVEAWEQINGLYLYARDELTHGLNRRGRFAYLNQIVAGCQRLTGLLFGTMSHNAAYAFLRLGRNLERTDMGTRILDVAAYTLLTALRAELSPYLGFLWIHVLKSLSGYQMYRLYVHHRVNGTDVVNFVLKDRDFPRAVHACLDELAVSLETLPHPDPPLRLLARLKRHVTGANVPALLQAGLHDFIDTLQGELAELNNAITMEWFLPKAAA